MFYWLKLIMVFSHNKFKRFQLFSAIVLGICSIYVLYCHIHFGISVFENFVAGKSDLDFSRSIHRLAIARVGWETAVGDSADGAEPAKPILIE